MHAMPMVPSQGAYTSMPIRSWPLAEAKPAHFNILKTVGGGKSPDSGKASQLLTSLQTLVAAFQDRTGPKVADALLRHIDTDSSCRRQ